MQMVCLVDIRSSNCREVYMFDEPSSFLDIQQRLRAARVIRALVADDLSKYCIVVEHGMFGGWPVSLLNRSQYFGVYV